jgi:hypothetical protein
VFESSWTFSRISKNVKVFSYVLNISGTMKNITVKITRGSTESIDFIV